MGCHGGVALGLLKALRRILDARDNIHVIATINSRRPFLPRKLADDVTSAVHASLEVPAGEPVEPLPEAEIGSTTSQEVLRARQESINRERERRGRASKSKR
jgi:hypothetical protein